MSTSRKSAGAVIAVVVVLILFILPMFYVAALGPLVRLHERGALSAETARAVRLVYSPLILVTSSCPPANTALLWYLGFWVPDEGLVTQ